MQITIKHSNFQTYAAFIYKGKARSGREIRRELKREEDRKVAKKGGKEKGDGVKEEKLKQGVVMDKEGVTAKKEDKKVAKKRGEEKGD